LRPSANLERALGIASEFDISKESAARRYVALHDDCLAVAISHNQKLLYFERTRTFPHLCLQRGHLLPTLPRAKGGESVSPIEETDPSAWLSRPDGTGLFCQSLHQQNGFAISLLLAEISDIENSTELGDEYKRY